jgi:cytochrome c biogenesis protein CcdA
MINLASAFALLCSIGYAFVMGSSKHFSPGAFFIVTFVISYLLVKFSPLRDHLKPTVGAHISFVAAYVLMFVAFAMFILGTRGGGNPIGAGIVGMMIMFPVPFLILGDFWHRY